MSAMRTAEGYAQPPNRRSRIRQGRNRNLFIMRAALNPQSLLRGFELENCYRDGIGGSRTPLDSVSHHFDGLEEGPEKPPAAP